MDGRTDGGTGSFDDYDFDRMHATLAELRGKQVFFIGGAPKSGTTWLQLLLDAHPAVSCRGESHMVNEFGRHLAAIVRQHNALIAQKHQTLFSTLPAHPQIGRGDYLYLMATAIGLLLLAPEKAAQATALGEKTPNNVEHFTILRRVFPHARFLHIVRDGRDVAVSAWFHQLRVDPEAVLARYGSMSACLQELAAPWHTAVSSAAAFTQAHPGVCCTVRYEDLLRTPEAALAPVLRFLGVASDAEQARACHAGAAFSRLTGGRKPGEEDRDSFFRSGVAGGWRGHFDAAAQARFEATAGKMLKRFGYL